MFVPGDQPDMMAKAPGTGADALIVDLEDAVAPSARAEALAAAVRWVRDNDAIELEKWVRISGHSPAEEVAALVAPGLAGIKNTDRPPGRRRGLCCL